MKIFIGTDHAGFGLKEKLVPYLRDMGHEVKDFGSFEYNEEDDFTDFIIPVAKEVSKDPNKVRGIILGGNGQGEAIAANRFRYVRAIVYYGDKECIVSGFPSLVLSSREHDNSNVLSIGARFVTEEEAFKAVNVWLNTPFSTDKKYSRRLDMIEKIYD